MLHYKGEPRSIAHIPDKSAFASKSLRVIIAALICGASSGDRRLQISKSQLVPGNSEASTKKAYDLTNPYRKYARRGGPHLISLIGVRPFYVDAGSTIG